MVMIRDPFEQPDDDIRFDEESQDGPEEEAESIDTEIERLLDMAEEIDRCCRQGCRGCDRLIPEALPASDIKPDPGNDPPF